MSAPIRAKHCTTLGCDRQILARGLCPMHYQRWAKHGSTDATDNKGVGLAARMAQYTRRGEGCWLWTAGTDCDGYGKIFYQSKNRRAHRVAFELHHGRPPAGVVRHTCDNPPCVNPSHLVEGTVAENSADMVKRGRSLTGARNHKAKLTPAAVVEIRASGESLRALSARHGVAHQTIGKIKRNERWREVQP